MLDANTPLHELGVEQDILGILKTYFGFTQFRQGQEEIIRALLNRRDVLAVMPTGAGKSLCYQVPSLLLDGLTLVISPLISLMKDQVNALEAGDIPGAYLNSSLTPEDYYDTIRRAREGRYKMLYLAPERLKREDLRLLGEQVPIAMVVIDEAHCISQWGHDFRPSYFLIQSFIQSLPTRPITAAFTATATDKVKADILAILQLEDPFILTTGFNRENLYFGVQRIPYAQDKMRALLEYLKKYPDRSGIIYCATRKTVEDLCDDLNAAGFAATRYHAGLEDEERQHNQDDFIYDRKPLMVATNAFGMGIDKSNVSFVIHYNMPKNIESYYQEAGRAGRDGEAADCLLYYSPQDVQTNRYLITTSAPGEPPRDPELVGHNLELLKAMTYYATTHDCLRSQLLAYFGDTPGHYCGNCSNCTTQFESVDIRVAAQKIISCVYRIEQRGKRFGKLMVVDILRGGKGQKLLSQGLNTLSTYGIMADTDAHRIRTILDYLVAQNYLVLEGDAYPVLCIAPRSWEVIQEKTPLLMMLPKESASPRHKQSEDLEGLSSLDESLLSKLKALRNHLAHEARLPAYIIFSDASLQDMCRKKPRTPAQFLAVSGVGKVKMEKYGNLFTRLIQDTCGRHSGGPQG
ncbi:MAG: DNA helicase RecQ [Spirochaetaceae bacterium]|nr:DNA helicase RecQ [Spirochaetaceae bacterium]